MTKYPSWWHCVAVCPESGGTMCGGWHTDWLSRHPEGGSFTEFHAQFISPQYTECTAAQPTFSCLRTLRHSNRQIDFRRMFLRHSALHAGETRQHAATISRERCIVLMTDDDSDRRPNSCKPLSEAEFCLTLGLPPRDCGSWQRNQIAWRWQNQTTKESESGPSNIPHQQQHTSSTPTRTGVVC